MTKNVSVELNQEGINLFSKILNSIHGNFKEIDVYVSKEGITLVSRANSRNLSFRFNILPKGFTDSGLEIEEPFRLRLFRYQLQAVFKKSKIFSTALWEFMGHVTFILKNEKGLKNVTTIPAIYIAEDDEFPVVEKEVFYNAERKYEMRVSPFLFKDLLDIGSNYVDGKDDITIEKAMDTIRFITKTQSESTISELTVGVDFDLKWLEGDDGAILTFFDYLKDIPKCLDTNRDLTMVVSDEAAILIHQTTETYSLLFAIAGKKAEEEYEEAEEE